MGLLPRRRHRSAALNPTTPGLNHGSASAWPARPSSATKKKFGTVLVLAALGLQPASSAPTGRHLVARLGPHPAALLYVPVGLSRSLACGKGRRGASPLSQDRRLLLRWSGRRAAPARRIALIGAGELRRVLQLLLRHAQHDPVRDAVGRAARHRAGRRRARLARRA